MLLLRSCRSTKWENFPEVSNFHLVLLLLPWRLWFSGIIGQPQKKPVKVGFHIVLKIAWALFLDFPLFCSIGKSRTYHNWHFLLFAGKICGILFSVQFYFKTGPLQCPRHASVFNVLYTYIYIWWTLHTALGINTLFSQCLGPSSGPDAAHWSRGKKI